LTFPSYPIIVSLWACSFVYNIINKSPPSNENFFLSLTD
jgi:hypothetical protein